MLSMKLAFDKKGALGLVSKMERTIQTNRAEALAEINQTILRRIRRRFTTKVDGDGKAWRPWSKQTRRERLKRGTAALGILLETGRLRGGWRSNLNKFSSRIYNNTPYAYIHEQGVERIPRRGVMGADGGLSASDAKVALQIAKSYFAKAKLL